MGCISTKELNPNLHTSDENAFRVRVVRVVDTQSPPTRSLVRGILEVNPRSLIFEAKHAEPVIWELKRLRRYGLTDNVFTFESGRRCPTGPGIHVFHCSNADEFYGLFRHYLTTVFDFRDTFANGDQGPAFDHPSRTFPLPAAESNNYLEPEPMGMCLGLVTMVDAAGTISTVSACGGACGGTGFCGTANRYLSSTINESFSTSPLSLDTPSSSFTPDMLCHSLQQPTTPCGAAGGAAVYVNTAPTNGNLYLDHPLHSTAQLQSNNSAACSGNTFGTTSRKSLIRGSSLDVPPVECAPLCAPTLTPTSDGPHMYANIEGLGGSSSSGCSTRERDREKWLDLSTERCYENFNRADLPLLLQSPTTLLSPQDTGAMRKPELNSHRSYPDSPMTPVTPMPVGTPEVNYIVLDLDTPRSPTNGQCCTSSQNEQYSGLGSDHSLAASINCTDANAGSRAATITTIAATTASALPPSSSIAPTVTIGASGSMSLRTTTTTSLASMKTTTNTTKTHDTNGGAISNCSRIIAERKKEAPLGYSTIDFIKTCALFSSSKQTGEQDSSIEHDDGSTRKTRHSAAAARLLKRKACSISE